MVSVTVVIPAYNAEAFIGDALASIRDQTLREVEVLLVDDGSSDGTLQVAERFKDSLDLKIVQQANAGPAAARNVGVRKAQGRYCAFLDADDIMLPDRLYEQASLLEAEPDLGLVHSDLMTFDDRGVIHRTRKDFSDPCAGAILDRLLLQNSITTSTVMAPVERLHVAGPFNVRRHISEDFELWLRMADRWKVGYIDRPLVKYRIRPGSLSCDRFQIGLSALDVVQSFWATHGEYRRDHPDLYRKSLARHLAVIGAAARARGMRASALSYLLRSLAREPNNRTAWKQLLKALVLPSGWQRRSFPREPTEIV